MNSFCLTLKYPRQLSFVEADEGFYNFLEDDLAEDDEEELLWKNDVWDIVVASKNSSWSVRQTVAQFWFEAINFIWH